MLVRDYIDAHIADRLFGTELGALVRYSEAHFSRTFKRTFGEPSHGFLIHCPREQSAASLSTIALQCGFANQLYLCKASRQATDLSPTFWKLSHRTDDQADNLCVAESSGCLRARASSRLDADVHGVRLDERAITRAEGTAEPSLVGL
jgi:AraC-like DNA-binding protein